ncbi:FAD-dependent monooxygenase [Nonomuraea sp. ZG12]|uniref:FAD-dependent monooxygenase n=1 Tax=Nonomuraea sp. ZG12 TaxID=3452207 RepID=UPI003F8A5DFE
MDILISGASVAGPALAHWLRQSGHTITIVERAPELRDGGYAVDFRGEAHLTVLRRMGVLADVEREQTHMGALWSVNEAGKKLTAMPEDLFAGDVEILRGDLARILYEATGDGVTYVFGDCITSLTEEGDKVEVTFEQAPTRHFDLVIGADGVHSNVRALAFGPEEDYNHHLGLYCAVFTTANHLGLDHSGLTYSTPGKMVSSYSARDNAEARAVFWFASPPLDYDRRDVAQQRRLLSEAFAGVGWEAPRLLGEMGRAPDFYFDSISQIRMDRWSRGRVALLGDAAWCPSPLSGMGTGLAIVGAYVLAGELAAAGGDHRAAFARYERVMRDYADGCQKMGQGASKWMVPESRFMAWVMDKNYKVLPYLPWKKMMARSVRKTAEAVSLTDYDFTRPGGRAPR